MHASTQPKRRHGEEEKEDGDETVEISEFGRRELVTVDGSTELSFTGDLSPIRAMYVHAIKGCGRCVETPCRECKRAFRHRDVSMHQPYPSVMCHTPMLYKILFRYNMTEVAYHTLLVSYSAVYTHMLELLDPEKMFMNNKWSYDARAPRALAWKLWAPYLDKYVDDVCAALSTENDADPVRGRRLLIYAYEAVIATGMRAARAPNEAGFAYGFDDEMAFLCAPIRETPSNFLDVREFNAAHFKFHSPTTNHNESRVDRRSGHG